MLCKATLLISALLMAGVFALDQAAGRDFDLWLLYVAPIALNSLVLGTRYGYGAALAATGLLFLTGYWGNNPFASYAAFAFDRACEGLAYLLLVFLIGAARTKFVGSDSPPNH